ncbi:MAG: glycosyltransferase [Flammeovirgaceae bacterium]
MKFSIIIPSRNDTERLPATIQSIVDTQLHANAIEFVIVDDHSEKPISQSDLKLPSHIELTLIRNKQQEGVPRSRNIGAYQASGDIFVMTDSHVTFTHGWDATILANISDENILAGTIADTKSKFKGFGCKLVVPFMGTHWNRMEPIGKRAVHVASCAATVLKKETFFHIGGYDNGMIIYGAAEPEFSLRAWLSGKEIICQPEFIVTHEFKTKPQREKFISLNRPFMVHNNLRFGFLYLSENASLEMIRHFAMLFPDQIEEAIQLVENSDVWERKEQLQKELKYDFNWFINKFNLKDQKEREIKK